MSKSNRQRRAAKHREVRRDARSMRREPAEPDLFEQVRTALADPDPLHVLSYVSTLLAAIDPRGKNHPFARADAAPDAPTREELAAMFIDIPTPETTALLSVIAELANDDDVLRTRIRRELATRPDTGPPWLRTLGETSAYRAVRMGHVLGDGDNIMIGVRLAGSYELTFTVYIDHNLGRLVKDAFVVPEPIADMMAQYQRIADDPDVIWEELSLADARAWLDEAIEIAAITFPPFETESWPACRPLIEWVTRGLPEGGSGYERPQWDSAQVDQLADRFFASQWGRALDDADHRGLLESLLWYGTDYGPGDPLRWSGVQVEILFMDWLPRKIVAPADIFGRGAGAAAGLCALCAQRIWRTHRADGSDAGRDRCLRPGISGSDPLPAAAGPSSTARSARYRRRAGPASPSLTSRTGSRRWSWTLWRGRSAATSSWTTSIRCRCPTSRSTGRAFPTT